MEMATKIKLVQMNKHKDQMNVEKLIKESKFTLKHPYDIRLTEVILMKPIKREKLKLLRDFSNWCPCGKTGLTNKEFKCHIFMEHDGYELPNSILNRPPWVDLVDFYSDEAEILFSGI